jgi:BirA family biotin operon repressor/biotin-[acetyl-CoA-carboxylase] ligase
VARLPLLKAILRRFDHWFLALQEGKRDELFDAWRASLITIGQPISVNTGQAQVSGVAEDVEPSGALRVRDRDGAIHIVASGDIAPYTSQ